MSTAVESFTGRTSAMRTQTPWLASEDIDGLPAATEDGDGIPVVIEDVQLHKGAVMDGGRKVDNLYALKFKGKEKLMVINATNRKTLYAKYGADTREWRGKTINLYVKRGVRNPAGGTTNGIRIK